MQSQGLARQDQQSCHRPEAARPRRHGDRLQHQQRGQGERRGQRQEDHLRRQ